MQGEEVRAARPEGLRAGVMMSYHRENPGDATMGEDVEEAQELPVNPPRGGHDARQKGVLGARPGGISVTVPIHLGERSGLKELVDIGVAQLPVAGDVLPVVATELVGAGNVDDEVPVTADIGILDE